jgi:NAD(P)-dependent dehydrogenase (short-subunit alcohol dehydrogenase family)
MAEFEKVAIVTGAGSGIGRACAKSLSAVGFSVVLSGRRRSALEETAALLDNAAASLIVECDVRDEESVNALFRSTMERFGRLDLLFNNAGVFGSRVPWEEVELEEWRSTMDTNVTGTFLCTRAAFQIMKSQEPMGGRIINNGSISAYTPRENAVSYTAAKHAVTGLTKSAALDGRRYDIAVGQIDVGNATTHLSANIAEAQMDVAAVADAVQYMAQLPLEANVLFMTVMATKMPYVGRG